MKKFLSFYLFFLILTLLFSFLATKSFAAYVTESNRVVTQVGEGSSDIIPITQTSCPIPKNGVVGKVTCGSKYTLRNGCGHCDPKTYPNMGYCTYAGNDHAIDVYGPCNTTIYFPSINGRSIQWTHETTQNPGNNQQAQLFSGRDLQTGDKYWLEFHHTVPGSGNKGTHNSGEVAARVTCNGYNHTHMQIATGFKTGVILIGDWIDAAKYFCLGQ